MGEWGEVAVGDLAENFNRRRIPLSKIERDKRQGDYPYYGAQGVIDYVDGYLFDGQFLLVAEDGENLRSRKQPIARLVSGRFWVNNHAHVIQAKSDVGDDRFLLHAINVAPLSGRITGAAQPKLTKAALLDLAIRCPPHASQRRIAAVLSAFDELIEINERRIEVLEDLARSLYREWFVHFRFPCHQDVEMVDSELGPIPEGWGVGSFGDVAGVVVDGVSPADEPPSVKYVGLEHLPRRRTTLLDWGALDQVTSRKLRFRSGDTLFGKIRPYFHKVAWAGFDGVASSDTVVLRAKAPRVAALINATASSDQFVAETVASSNGTKMPRANPEAMLAYRLALPRGTLLHAFDERVTPMLLSSAHLANQNRYLAATRDLLLPRVVTGRLDISDLDLGALTPAEAG
ncbi:MAG: restriction endonuclease subunit S [Solirubrobacterales bacterium]